MDEPDATMDTARHATHDRELVAALIDRELTGSERERARALVDACTACATLHDDLRTLAVAARDLPVPARPRDFMLSPADAERLRPTLIRRLLGAIGTSRDAVSRPLAMGLTTLGLAGLLVATVPSALPMGGIQMAPAENNRAGEAQPTTSSDTAAEDPSTMDSLQSGDGSTDRGATVADQPAPILAASLALLASGLAIGGVRMWLMRGRGNHGTGRAV